MEPQCEACHSTVLITNHENGFVVCGDCGQVQDRVWSFEPEHKWYDEEERRTRDRTGDPLSIQTMAILGLPSSTFITSTDYMGSSLEMHDQKKYRRLLTYQKGSKISRKRHFSKVHAEIRKACHQLQLPDTLVQDVLSMYIKASERGLLRGRSKLQVILALIHMIAIKKGLHFDLKDVEDAWGIKPRKIRKMATMLNKTFCIEMNAPNSHLSTKQMIMKLGEELKMDPQTIKLASDIHDLAKRCDKNHLLDGKRPSSIAAACVYLASLSRKERLTLETMSQKLGITKITLRKRSKQIAQIMQQSGKNHLVLAM